MSPRVRVVRSPCGRGKSFLRRLPKPISQRLLPMPTLRVTSAPVVPNTSCVRCETAGWRFSEVVTLGPYRGRLREAVILMKKRPFELLRRGFGELLASELALRVQDSNPVLLSMPNHWSRTYLRRICHASSLARALSTKLEWPIVRGVVARTRKTAKQGMLSWSERSMNVRGAFRVRLAKRIEGRCVVLVDDVLTSGATANEVSKVLMRAGAAKVYCRSGGSWNGSSRGRAEGGYRSCGRANNTCINARWLP